MDQVIADYLSGLSARACARKHSIDTHTVLNNLRRRGITPEADRRSHADRSRRQVMILLT